MLREKIDELIAQETKCNSGCLGILKLIGIIPFSL